MTRWNWEACALKRQEFRPEYSFIAPCHWFHREPKYSQLFLSLWIVQRQPGHSNSDFGHWPHSNKAEWYTTSKDGKMQFLDNIQNLGKYYGVYRKFCLSVPLAPGLLWRDKEALWYFSQLSLNGFIFLHKMRQIHTRRITTEAWNKGLYANNLIFLLHEVGSKIWASSS